MSWSRVRPVMTIPVRVAQLSCGAASAYLGGLTVLAWIARARGLHRPLGRAPGLRLAVLIPAHDEEALIGATVDSVLASDYPPELLQVHVIADHCTDRTAEIATRHGAIVHEHSRPGGKGAALSYALDRLSAGEPRPDAVAVVDADTLVDPDCFREAVAWLDADHHAVQAYYGVRDPATTPVTALRAAALAVRHYVRPLARTSVGGSCGLFGNGMVFRFDTADAHRWSSHLTEDIELQLDLLLAGERIAFAPAARVVAEMPTTLAASTTQNERWERGRLEMLRRYGPRLLRRGPHRAARIDAAADLALPPFSLLAAATVGATALGVIAGPRRRRAAMLGAAAASVQAGHLLSGLVMTRAPWAVYRSLLHAPRLVWWKVALWTRVARRDEATPWTRTARNDQDPGAAP